jgi:putative transposase
MSQSIKSCQFFKRPNNMAKTEHYHTQFEAGCFYHVYNRTIDKGKLFAKAENYIFFLKKYNEYLSGFVDTYAYCLLGNHFHLLIGILPEADIRANLEVFEKSDLGKKITQKKIPTDKKTVHELVSHQFKKFFQSYAMAFNKQQDRVGTLFQTPFKRALIDNDQYFTNMVYYIHSNPKKHGFVTDFKQYEWSSYQRMLIEKPTKLRKREVLNWFGGKESYLLFHTMDDSILPKNWNLDDDDQI